MNYAHDTQKCPATDGRARSCLLYTSIISQIVKKLQKDKSVAEIADDLEEKEEVIAPIYEAALSMKPDYDVEKIYELLEKNKKLA